jgi:iron complex outermembrane recepter protein
MLKAMLWTTVAGSVLLSAPAALAQSTSPAGDGEISHAVTLEDVVVTARKRDENLQGVPVAVTAINSELLTERGVNDVRDLAKVAPGLTVTQSTVERHAFNISIRGQSSVVTPDGTVGTYLDGVNVPYPFGVSPTLVDLERVEVLRGSQGTLYGRNTTGGAINIITRGPNLTDVGGFLTLKAGSFKRYDLSGAVDLPLISNQLAVRLTANVVGQDGTGVDGEERDVNDDGSQYYRARVRWEPNDRFRAGLTADHTRIRDGGRASRLTSTNGFPPRDGLPLADAALFEVAAESGLITFDPEDPANQDQVVAALAEAQTILDSFTNGAGPGRSDFYDTGGTFRQFSNLDMTSVGLTLAYDITDDWQIKSTSGYRGLDREGQSDLDATPFTILHANQFITDDFYSQELQLNYTGERFHAIVGLYGSTQEGEDGSRSVAFAALAGDEPFFQNVLYTNDSWAIYGQADYDLTSQLTLTVGARWTEESKDSTFVSDGAEDTSLGATFSDYSYLIGLDFKASEDLMFYGKVARGFRGGGINGPDDSGGPSAYEPEITQEYELGFKADLLSNHVRINAAAYRTEYQDVQRVVLVSSAACNCTFQSTQNAAEATIQGLEAEIVARVTDRFTLTGAVGLVDAQYDKFEDETGDRSGEPFPIPEVTYNLSARYEHPVDGGQLVFRVDYAWLDDQVYRPQALDDAGVTQPAYGLVNARIALQLDRYDAEVALFGRNIGAKEYLGSALEFDDFFGFNLGFQGEPQTWGVEFTKRFGGG